MRLQPSINTTPSQQNGFSLLEMAIVMMIMGILMSGVLISVSQTTLNARRASALAQLRQVEDALYGFAESQKRLPCPASIASAGYEAITAGDCDLMHGFVPAATLGTYGETNTDGLLVDAWGNPLRYSLVITAGAGNPDFSKSGSINAFFNLSTAITEGNTLKVCDDSTCTGKVLSDTALAVILTMGENWDTYSSAQEVTNAGTSTLGSYPVHTNAEVVFIASNYVENQYDDQLVWLSPYVLFNHMVSAGKLP
jgi:prepilin-type N-terminal cleavage/methylation domain-containing protein